MKKTLVVVESPTKAKTISKFLGPDYIITSSYGHIRDLPDNAKGIPENLKKEKWARLGVNVDKDFEPLYIVPTDKKKRITELKSFLKESDTILLATDEDREGESISWHLLEVLKPKIPVKRLVFHEITKKAIAEALSSPREVDMNLVKAQETRRIVDRLFGYTLSPLLWKKMAPRLSAGRVQSVALRLTVERERERISFRSATYWDLKGTFKKEEISFSADIISYDQKKIATTKDFDSQTGKLTNPENVFLIDEQVAKKLKSELEKEKGKVLSLETKPYTTKPFAPFVTSTLQQDASAKLRFTARHTMQVAQKLYENGFITYMRTDSTNMSEEAINGARKLIVSEFGQEYLSPQIRVYKTKVKNAQEAHEAIRPAGDSFASVDTVKKALGEEASRLYDLIYKRTLACQMKDSEGLRQTLEIQLGKAVFKTVGRSITFLGYLKAYDVTLEDSDKEQKEEEKIIPNLKIDEKLDLVKLEDLAHITQAPPRFTEGSLIKELEKRGIGRPSTWASIVDLILSKNYVFKKGTALVPSFLAIALVKFLEDYFTDLVDYSFTAELEDDLDAISRGEADSLQYLKSFYFGNKHLGILDLVKKGEETIDPRIVCGIEIGKDQKGDLLEVRIGKFGAFLRKGDINATIPERICPDELNLEKAKELIEISKRGPESLGKDPETNKPVYLKNGRFGPYIQLGDKEDSDEKPKMASILPNMKPENVDLDTALLLLSLPRSLGKNPETQEDVIAANGKFGPYVQSGKESRSIDLETNSPISITFDEALALLKEPKKRAARGKSPSILKEVGEHPISKKKMIIKTGRFGPYVTDGTINASLPRGMTPEEIDIDEAVNLLEARAAKIASQE